MTTIQWTSYGNGDDIAYYSDDHQIVCSSPNIVGYSRPIYRVYRRSDRCLVGDYMSLRDAQKACEHIIADRQSGPRPSITTDVDEAYS